jgi:hypothetical protein
MMDSPDGAARVAKYSGVKVGCFPHHSSALHCTSTLPKSSGYPKSELNVFPFYLFFTPITFLQIEPEREIQANTLSDLFSFCILGFPEARYISTINFLQEYLIKHINKI